MNAPARIDAPAAGSPNRFRLRVADYLLLHEQGRFGDLRTELVDGEVLVLSPEWRPHFRIKNELLYRLRRAIEAAGLPYFVGSEGSVALSDTDMPLPDILLTSEPGGDGPIPSGSVPLVVEIAATTIKSDLGSKGTRYAINRRMRKTDHCNHVPSQDQAGVQLAPTECHLVADPSAPARIDGNLARRTCLNPGVYWDDMLPGFGLRVRTSGHKSWVVKLRERGSQAYVTLGAPPALSAPDARTLAQKRLADAMLDGLPRRPAPPTEQTFRGYAERFWSDYARHWKPSTEKRNARCLRCDLLPWFGDLSLSEIARSDILRWRDSLVGRQATFNRALPVLSVMLGYAEKVGVRRAGSNPCKGTPRYSRHLPDRYLSTAEYRRLGRVLADAEAEQPVAVTAIRLLMFTGARSNEILSLRWEYVDGTRLNLPDSKTGPKTVWLNLPALDALDLLPRSSSGPLFPAPRVGGPMQLYPHWDRFRRQAALPDVRLHDLRHSFASIAIADGMPLTMIGRLLGHALPETTARYAHLADDVIADAATRVSGGIAEALGLDR